MKKISNPLRSVSVIGVIRIVTLTQLDLLNLTGTMIWADFWSATEPNLAILCVSLPMLGSLWKRMTANRGGGSEAKSSGYYSSESNTIGSSAFSKIKNQDTERGDTDTQIRLESLYAANQEVHYQSAVATTTTPEPVRMLVDHKDKDSGSEVSLTEVSPYQTDRNGIRVHTKWSISHN